MKLITPQSKLRKLIKSIVLWNLGATIYFYSEVVFKSIVQGSGSISWTMMLLAFFISIPLDMYNERITWNKSFLLQAIEGGVLITIIEFIAGVILNVWLKLGVWDYSNNFGNLLGQICVKWFFIWIVVAAVGIVIFDYLRYILWSNEEEKPHYKIL